MKSEKISYSYDYKIIEYENVVYSKWFKYEKGMKFLPDKKLLICYSFVGLEYQVCYSGEKGKLLWRYAGFPEEGLENMGATIERFMYLPETMEELEEEK